MKPAVLLAALGCALSLATFGQNGPAAAWTGSRLPNGLDIVVAENHSSPFVRIDLAFRAGAVAQGSANAGAFHVLEHALLAAGGPDGSAEADLARLGVSEWKAETGAEYLSFDMKIPSEGLEEGLGVWAAMMGRSGFDAATLEAAETRAAAEAAAQVGDPQAVYEAAMTKRVFSRFPWRRDPVGSESAIKALSAEGLQKLRSTWLIPSNAVLILSGDLDADAALAAAGKAFGSWKGGPSPWTGNFTPQPKLGVMRPTWFSLADPRVPEGLAWVEIRYRGPDLASDPKAAFSADLWAELLSTPDSRFQKAMASALPFLHGPVLVQFLSQRDGSVISVSAGADLGEGQSALRAAEQVKEAFRGTEVMNMKLDPSYFAPEELRAAAERLETRRLAALDKLEGLDSELRFAWCSASLDWFQNWDKGIGGVDREALSALVNDWILHNLEVVAIRISPAEATKEGAALSSGGFEKAGPDNSFWWQGR